MEFGMDKKELTPTLIITHYIIYTYIYNIILYGIFEAQWMTSVISHQRRLMIRFRCRNHRLTLIEFGCGLCISMRNRNLGISSFVTMMSGMNFIFCFFSIMCLDDSVTHSLPWHSAACASIPELWTHCMEIFFYSLDYQYNYMGLF